jgi:hypothetical protein
VDTPSGRVHAAVWLTAVAGRLTSMTDAIGLRNVRYDAVTGAVDSVSDPRDGWVRYTMRPP